MKLSEYIDMRCIIHEYANLQEWRAEELYKADYWPKHIYATIGICISKAEWARKMVKKMDMKISDWWGWSEPWTNDNSISDEVWEHRRKSFNRQYWLDSDYQI